MASRRLQPIGELTAQVGWLGLSVNGCLALSCIRQINRLNARIVILSLSIISLFRPIVWIIIIIIIIIII